MTNPPFGPEQPRHPQQPEQPLYPQQPQPSGQPQDGSPYAPHHTQPLQSTSQQSTQQQPGSYPALYQPYAGQQPPYGAQGYGAPFGYAQPPAPKRRKPLSTWRAVAAGAVAGAVLAAAVAVPTTIDIVHSNDGGSASSAPASGGTQQQDPFGSNGVDPFDPFSEGGSSSGDGSSGDGSTADQSGTNATDAQSKGVVLVDTVTTGGAGAGTGMVIDSDGLVLTNYHVVESSTSIKVTIASTGDTYDATVVGRDKADDVALIQLTDASGLDTVATDTDGVSPDEAVTAVGNASGQGFLSAVDGTVVAEDQHITASEGSGPYADSEALTGLIETDAAVVPGYSGGPLLDADGEVVGIDTAASTSTSAMGVAQNTGQAYAIPIEDALKIAEQIQNGDESGSVQIGPSPFLGISVNQAAARAQGVGAAVAGVEDGGPAADAGITAGDTITAVDGSSVTSYDALVTALGAHEPGDSVKLTWTTAAGKTESKTVTLGSSPVN